jgi:hypothetical protein
MKKLGLLALLLSIGVASVGCEPAKKKDADKKPGPDAAAPADKPVTPPAGDAKPAETPADAPK